MKTQIVQLNSTIKRFIPADAMFFHVFIKGEGETKEKCAADYNKAAAAAKRAFTENSVSPEDVRDEHFTVHTHMETLYEKANKYGYEDYYSKKKIVDGYEYSCDIFCKLPIDSSLFARIWSCLQSCPEQVSFLVTFGLIDEDAARDELLTEAVTAARAKAQILASAADCELGSPLRINLGGLPEELHSGTAWGCCESPCEAPDYESSRYEAPSFNPKDVSVECTVFTEWELIEI